MKIAAGIVLYKPNKDRLIKCINLISKQVDTVFLYNNGCDFNVSTIANKKNIKIIGNSKNIGLASALNEIFNFALKEKFEWVISLDQDSIVPKNIISKFLETYRDYKNNDRIAIVCPKFIDKRREESKFEVPKSRIELVDVCITSASMTRLDVWNSIDGFDDNLFIDLIDNDFCKRLKINNWKILKINDIILDQEKGEIIKKTPRKVAFYMGIAKVVKKINPLLAKNISKLTYKKKVVPMRVYYTNRNIIYLNAKYKKYGGIGYIGYINYNCKSYFGFHISFNLPSLIRGKNKIKIIKAIIKGIKDGVYMKKNIYEVDKC